MVICQSFNSLTIANLLAEVATQLANALIAPLKSIPSSKEKNDKGWVDSWLDFLTHLEINMCGI